MGALENEKSPQQAFAQVRGILFWCPCIRDPTILKSVSGLLIFGSPEYQHYGEQGTTLTRVTMPKGPSTQMSWYQGPHTIAGMVFGTLHSWVPGNALGILLLRFPQAAKSGSSPVRSRLPAGPLSGGCLRSKGRKTQSHDIHKLPNPPAHRRST